MLKCAEGHSSDEDIAVTETLSATVYISVSGSPYVEGSEFALHENNGDIVSTTNFTQEVATSDVYGAELTYQW